MTSPRRIAAPRRKRRSRASESYSGKGRQVDAGVQLCRAVWQRWLETAVLSGALDADPDTARPVQWIPPRWDWVDPLKDIQALVLAMEAGITSRRKVVEATGYDIEEVDRENAADAERPSAPPVMTGHAEGLVTLALVEADPAEREKRREEMGEPYRSLLGHLRHEIGHFYWDLLVRDGGRLEEARQVFGDERADYATALERHYQDGPPAAWAETHVSTYATSHPWEDFAETWAHCLHIIDTLDTAQSFRIVVAPQGGTAAELEPGFDAYAESDMERLIALWLPLTYAVNSLNRSMGQPDLYPFVLSPAVIAKLGFVRRLIAGAGLG